MTAIYVINPNSTQAVTDAIDAALNKQNQANQNAQNAIQAAQNAKNNAQQKQNEAAAASPDVARDENA